MASKKGGKKANGEDLEAAVLRWFECEGEPATVQSLTDALGSKFGKQLVQNTLEQCLKEQKLLAKDIKKARFYFLASPAPGSNDEGSDVGSHKIDLVKQLRQLRNGVSMLSSELSVLLQAQTSSKRATTIASLVSECAALRSRLQALHVIAGKESSCVSDDVSLLIHRYKRARELWRDRKRITVCVIDAVLGDSCGPQELEDIFGLSTDEQMNLCLSGTALTLPATVSS